MTDLCDGITKHDRHNFDVKYSRGGKERPCKLHLYSIASPQAPTVGTNVSYDNKKRLLGQQNTLPAYKLP